MKVLCHIQRSLQQYTVFKTRFSIHSRPVMYHFISFLLRLGVAYLVSIYAPLCGKPVQHVIALI